ncbi:universal stress protein [Halomicroarcula sp. F13]|uniref:Universal stress protein n=1 Tax=Haloarcula rubra TaxID=2487747 RepID=A0AAW4PKN1_9EURY|nr:universal stress protein [Halomicroarcula rubra]MBX0321621.1 universal stress protein [Halomicroarcula rubra]
MTILVAVANDAVSDGVIDTAVRLGEALDEELYVVHLLDDQLADAEAKRVRDMLRERLADETVVATVALEHVGRSSTRKGTRIGEELLEVATDVDISHIVMGHEPKGLRGRLASGDAAFSVVDAASVPVTIVPNSSS